MNINKFEIRPITINEIDSVSRKCWWKKENQLKIIEKQEILGIGASNEDNICVGQFHCYSVSLPQWDDYTFPDYARRRLEDWPLGWSLLAEKQESLQFEGPVWGIACFHVGYLPDSQEADPVYFNRGIGKALLAAAVDWAKTHDYSGIITLGGPREIPSYNIQMGCLPWTSYDKLGFETKVFEENRQNLP